VNNPDTPKDDLREYRSASATPSWQPKRTAVPRPPPEAAQQRAQYAEQVARSEFGRFYWNGTLDKRFRRAMQRRPKANRDMLNGKTRK
jgi:hypothetical protein